MFILIACIHVTTIPHILIACTHVTTMSHASYRTCADYTCIAHMIIAQVNFVYMCITLTRRIFMSYMLANDMVHVACGNPCC